MHGRPKGSWVQAAIGRGRSGAETLEIVWVGRSAAGGCEIVSQALFRQAVTGGPGRSVRSVLCRSATVPIVGNRPGKGKLRLRLEGLTLENEVGPVLNRHAGRMNRG